jgi:predicted ATPase
VDERNGLPVVKEEWLQWRRGTQGKPFRFLDYREGQGRAISGELPDEQDDRIEIPLKSPDLIAVNALGQFAAHPRVASLRDFITGWHVSYLSVDDTRGQPEAGPQERLSRTGDNLANVIQYLAEQHPSRLEKIFEVLRNRVPHVEKVLAEAMPDGRLLLQIKDAPFDHPVLARFASDGTLKMLAYLVLQGSGHPRNSGIYRGWCFFGTLVAGRALWYGRSPSESRSSLAQRRKAMSTKHLEILVEEPSMEAFLRELIPRMLGDEMSFEVYPFQCQR